MRLHDSGTTYTRVDSTRKRRRRRR